MKLATDTEEVLHNTGVSATFPALRNNWILLSEDV